MTKKFLILALVALFTMPCVLRADEVEIQLMEVIGMGTLPGDDPLDGPGQYPGEPPRPTDFHATITGNSLSITNQSNSIPSAQAMVVNASTGGIVLNQQFTTSLAANRRFGSVCPPHRNCQRCLSRPIRGSITKVPYSPIVLCHRAIQYCKLFILKQFKL